MNQNLKDELNQLSQFDAFLIDKDMFSSELALLYRKNPNVAITYIQSVLENIKMELQSIILQMPSSKASVISNEEMLIRNSYDSWNRLLKLAMYTKTNMIAYNQKRANASQYGNIANAYSYQPMFDEPVNVDVSQQTTLSQIQPEPIVESNFNAQNQTMDKSIVEDDDDIVVWDIKKKPITKEGKKRIGKIELTERIATIHNLRKTVTKRYINFIFEDIVKTLIRHEPVELDNFAKFMIIEKLQREGYNPLTRERIIIPAGKVVKIKLAANAKRIINNKNQY